MPDRYDNDDGWDDDVSPSEMDDDADEEGEADEDFNESTLPCPKCGRPIYEDAERCPRCGYYVTALEGYPARKPWWIILGALLAIYAVYRWITG